MFTIYRHFPNTPCQKVNQVRRMNSNGALMKEPAARPKTLAASHISMARTTRMTATCSPRITKRIRKFIPIMASPSVLESAHPLARLLQSAAKAQHLAHLRRSTEASGPFPAERSTTRPCRPRCPSKDVDAPAHRLASSPDRFHCERQSPCLHGK